MGKKVSDLVGSDAKIGEDGSVTGTIKYVEDFTEFSSDLSEQNGNYFPLMLNIEYEGKEITVKRDGVFRNKAKDREWVLFVPTQETTFTFETGGKVFQTLNFEGAELAKRVMAVRSSSRRKMEEEV